MTMQLRSEQTLLAQLRAGQLTGTVRLDLSCGLTEFPREIFELADSLEILNLSGNALSRLPDDLPRLHKLRILFCSDNQFTALPEVLGQCKNLTMLGFKANRIDQVPDAALAPSLQWLILTDNRIQQLPRSIGQCQQMQKLMLAGNQLTDLPVELAGCTRLELLRLSANQFTTLPPWLLAMPCLAWLALAGNPMTDAYEANRDAVNREERPINHIDWQRIALGPQLGEGASGVIYQATLQQATGSTEDVAAKLFKSAVTSDGLPRSEMAACMAVGSHPHVVGAMGRIAQHPAGVQGLVMPLIAPSFSNLAAPPSLASCTRDVYEPDTVLTLQTVLRMALGVAGAARHLHACGLMHGDVYAHNILHNPQGHSLLGDFGAASFLPTDDPDSAQAWQRLEVRAYGILLGELLARCAEPRSHGDQATKAQLVAWQQRCTQAVASARPLFDVIVPALAALKSF
ncbi:MAG: leucine-rich repeat-containing protein kinase family protein [Burkholderiaceae bacterium]